MADLESSASILYESTSRTIECPYSVPTANGKKRLVVSSQPRNHGCLSKEKLQGKI